MLGLKPQKRNKYDISIILIIALQAFGGIGGALQPVRIFIILFVPSLIYFFLKHKSIASHYKYEGITFYIWIVYGLTSLIWVIYPQESIKEIIYLIVYFFGFFLIVFFSNKALQPKESIIRGWGLLFTFTVPIALVELILDIHLPSAYHADNLMENFGNGLIFQRHFASVTYGNLNSYNTILVYTLPFILGNLMNNDSSNLKKFFGIIISIILTYVIVANGSRGAFICLFLVIMIFIGYYMRNIKAFISIGIIFLIGISFLLFLNNDFFLTILFRLQEQGLEDNARSNLITMGIDALVKSYLLGIGAGNFTAVMHNMYLQELTAPHNLFLEVLVQYGLIIFTLFIGMLIKILKKNRHNKNKRYRFIVLSSIVMYPVSAIIDSGYILNSATWLFIVSLYIIADKKYDRAYG